MIFYNGHIYCRLFEVPTLLEKGGGGGGEAAESFLKKRRKERRGWSRAQKFDVGAFGRLRG